MMNEERPCCRVMLVDDTPARAALVEQALAEGGYDVVVRLSSASGLLRQVEQHQPDVIIIDLESPDRDVLESMSLLHQHAPKPVVMFAETGERGDIERAMRAGVSAYVVDGLEPHRVLPVLTVATARFREFQTLRVELEQTRTELADRKLLDHAKRLLIRHRQLDEPQAHQMLRKLSMDQGQPLLQVAQDVVSVLELLDR